jgi:hypothetical protein
MVVLVSLKAGRLGDYTLEFFHQLVHNSSRGEVIYVRIPAKIP